MNDLRQSWVVKRKDTKIGQSRGVLLSLPRLANCAWWNWHAWKTSVGFFSGQENDVVGRKDSSPNNDEMHVKAEKSPTMERETARQNHSWTARSYTFRESCRVAMCNTHAVLINQRTLLSSCPSSITHPSRLSCLKRTSCRQMICSSTSFLVSCAILR